MVQPPAQVGSTSQWEMSAGEGGSTGGQGSLRVPPDLAENEVVSRLLMDNQLLRDALRRSNMALRERCDEMEQWQQRTRMEKEFLSCRFQEAKALVERLSQENQALRSQLNHTAASAQRGTPSLEPIILDIQRIELSPCLETAEDRVGKEVIGPKHQTPDKSLPIDGANEFLKLLKNHKEKLEENLRELRRQNEELERRGEQAERERDELQEANRQLQLKLAQIQGGGVTEEVIQQSQLCAEGPEISQVAKLVEELQITQSRYTELQEKFDSLQKTAVQWEKTEARLKQKDKELEQMTKDSEALKAQVTSLLGELNERQSCLEKSEEERTLLQENLSTKTEALQTAERDMESLRRMHSVTVDQLRLQTENLETALKTERMVLTEEKRKLAQLQHAYTQLFQDYDAKLRNGGEVEDLGNRLAEAERALALKQELIDKLKEEVERQRAALETVPVLTAQAEIYKVDFLAERAAREKLNQRKEELQDQLNKALKELERLKVEATSRACMEEMQLRHVDEYRTALPLPGGLQSEEQPDFRCPKCQYQAPDIDTLQIHVMDCIQ